MEILHFFKQRRLRILFTKVAVHLKVQKQRKQVQNNKLGEKKTMSYYGTRSGIFTLCLYFRNQLGEFQRSEQTEFFC